MPENKNSLDPKKEDDIEKLDFGNDDEIELKIDDISIDDGNIDLKIDPSNTKTEDSLAPTSNGDVSPSEVNNQGDNTSVDTGDASQNVSDTPSNLDNNSTNENTPSTPTSQEQNEASSGDQATSSNAAPSTSEGSEDENQPLSNDANNQNKEQSQDDKNNKDNKSEEKENQNKDKENNKDNKDNKDNKENQNKNDDNRKDNGNDRPNNKNDQDYSNKNSQDNPKDNQNGNKNNRHDEGKNQSNSSISNNKERPKSGLDKKREDLKNKWNNRPRTPKEAAQRAGNNLKNRAANAFNNSKAGKAINNAKKVAEKAKKTTKKIKDAKKTATVIKVLLASKVFIAILIALVIFCAIIFAVSFFVSGSPGVGGDVEDEENYSKYSEVDQATIEKLKSIYESYPDGDPALAMVTAIYPYMEELHGGNVNSLKANNNSDDYEDEEDSEDQALVSDDTEDTKDNENDAEEDDPYLELLRSWSFRTFKFKKLLKWTTDGEESYNNNLKEKYFTKDKGYKAMFDGCEDEDALADAIIKDLYDLKDDFEGYFFDVCITADGTMTYLNAAGEVQGFTGDIYVTLRDYRSTNGSFVKEDYYNSPVLYNTDSNPLPFSRYVMGVVYAEAGESCITNEVCAKTLMVTAKSYALGRQKSMGYDYEEDATLNRTIIHMRGNVGDQDFCDVYEGCESGTYSKETWTYTGEGYNNRKPALATDQIAQLEAWWNEIANEYVIRKSNNSFAGAQYNDYNDNCKKGYCVSQTKVAEASKTETDYKNVLYNSENGGFDNAQFVAYLSDSNGVYAVSTGEEVCSDGTISATRQEVVNFARSMVGKIPYYYYGGQSDGYGALGHAISKNFDDNHFGEEASIADQSGRNQYGLDCSGFVNFVFWNVLDNNLGNGNTDNLKSISTEITYNELKPGDLGFISNDSAGTEQHVGIYVGNDKWIELNPNGVTEGAYPDFKVYYRLNILAELDAEEQAGEMYGDMENAIQGQFFAPVQENLPMYGKNSTNGNTYHDLEASCGTPVYAPADGIATFKTITKGGRVASYGNEVEINTTDGYRIVLAHLESFVGYNALYGSESTYPSSCSGRGCTTDTYGTRNVKKGEMVGTSGTSGNSTGCHLHIEIWHNGTRLEPSNLLGYSTR